MTKYIYYRSAFLFAQTIAFLCCRGNANDDVLHSKIYIPKSPVINLALEKALDHSITEDTHMFGPSEEMANILVVMGEILVSNNEYEEAYRVYEELLHIQENAPDNDGLAIAATLASIGHIKQAMGDFDGAFYAFSEILDLQDDVLTQEDIADTLFAMGLVLLEGGHYTEALEIMHDAIEAHESVPNKDSSFIASTLDYIGELCIRLGRIDDAINYWADSSNLWREMKNYNRLADTLNSIGVAYFRSEEYDTAKEIYEESIYLYRTYGNESGQDHLKIAIINYSMVSNRMTNLGQIALNDEEEEDSNQEEYCTASYHLNGKINEAGTYYC